VADVSDNFNFYDIYGYLLPGVALTLVLLFPFWCYGRGPTADFGLGSALAATITAYMVGHLLQTIAVSAIPSTVRSKPKAARRYPSDILLDHDDETFTTGVKDQVAREIRSTFSIDVNDKGNLSANRRDAFFLCRDVLVASKRASYVEQFEGMYSLMRGLTAALLLGAGYLAGWALALRQSHGWVLAERSALALSLAAALGAAVAGYEKLAPEPTIGKWILAGLSLALAAVGHYCGGHVTMTAHQSLGLAAACVLALLLCLRCHGAYAVFAREYAKAVWRGFLAGRKTPTDPAK
jgi:hypothetical protein